MVPFLNNQKGYNCSTTHSVSLFVSITTRSDCFRPYQLALDPSNSLMNDECRSNEVSGSIHTCGRRTDGSTFVSVTNKVCISERHEYRPYSRLDLVQDSHSRLDRIQDSRSGPNTIQDSLYIALHL